MKQHVQVIHNVTLITYIPYDDGSLIISDRQNTYFDDMSREPINKIIAIPSLNSIIGFAGPTQMGRYLIDQLRYTILNLTFIDTYRDVYERCYGTPMLGFREEDVEFLVVNIEGGNKKLYKIIGSLTNEIDLDVCTALGCGSKYLIPQLQLEAHSINRHQAEQFGLRLLKYVSIIDIRVGDPLIYGYNISFVEEACGPVITNYPENVDISNLLYTFE